MRNCVRSLACILVAGVCLGPDAGAYAFQGHGGGRGGSMGGMGGGFPSVDRGSGGGIRDLRTSRSERPSMGRGALQLAPPGRWWDDKSLAKKVKLRPDQQVRMDNIFAQNRSSLLSSYVGLQQAESRMQELSKAPNLDEAVLNAQIDRVSQARAELEKANMHLQLQLRKEMDPEQLAELEKQQQPR